MGMRAASWSLLRKEGTAGLHRRFELRRVSGPVIPPGEIGRLLQPFQAGTAAAVALAIGPRGAALTTRAQPGGGLHVEVGFPVAKAVATTQQDSRAAEARAVMGF